MEFSRTQMEFSRMQMGSRHSGGIPETIAPKSLLAPVMLKAKI